MTMLSGMRLFAIFAFVALASSQLKGAQAADADPLQDFCVADLSQGSVINGYPCKPVINVSSDDFLYSALASPSNLTGNILAGKANLALVRQWPALNTLGVSIARLDINPGGVIVPHTHNLATEVLFCLQGEIYTGFVTNSNTPKVPNKLYSKVVKAGEAFIFPRGLLHFQLNNGTVPAASVNFLNAQNPGIQLMNVAMFGVGIDIDVLTKSFFVPESVVQEIEPQVSQLINLFEPTDPAA